MGRQAVEEGAEFIAQNGYKYIKVGEEWRPAHHLVAEQKLGRRLIKGERVSFIDNNRSNLNPNNLKIKTVTTLPAKMKRKNQILRRIEKLQEELTDLEDDM